MSKVEMEDFTGLVSPPGLPDLTDASLARAVPLAILALATGVRTPYLQEFLDNPANGDALPAVEGFTDWCASNIDVAGRDAWLDYLATSRADLLTSAWAAYDPDGLVEVVLRDTSGDDLIGASLWFTYLAAVGVISDDDEPRWYNLWTFLIVNDLLGDEDEDDESTSAPTKEDDEW